MDISFEQYEEIQQYLDGTMPAGEIVKFEHRLAVDRILNEHYLFEKDLRKNLRIIGEETDNNLPPEKKDVSPLSNPNYMRTLIEKAGREYSSQITEEPDPGAPLNVKNINRPASISLWPGLAAAALIFLVLTGIIWFIISNNRNTPEIVDNKPKTDTTVQKKPEEQIVQENVTDTLKRIIQPEKQVNLTALYKEFFKKDTVPALKPAVLAYAMDKYSDGDYGILQRLDIENLPVSRGAGDTADEQKILAQAHYFKGLSLLMDKGNVKQAAVHFQWVVANSADTQLIIKAEWYLALASIRLKKPQEANRLLKSIRANNNAGPYKKQSEYLLKRLNQK